MKRFLCYSAIFLLILLIAIPPLTRVFYKEKKVEVVPDKYFMLTCTKDFYVVSESYKNDEVLSIKFKRPFVDSNLDVYSDKNSIEYTLDNELKNLVNANIEGEKTEEQSINYLLQYKNIVEDKLSGLTNYRLPIDKQISYYQSYGYTCEKIEQ